MSLCAALLDCFMDLKLVVPISKTNIMCRLFVEVPILLLMCMCITFEIMMKASALYILTVTIVHA